MKNSKFNIVSKYGENYIIFNSFTGAVLLLNKDEYTLLKAGRYEALSQQDITILFKEGIVIDDTMDEVGLLRYAYNYSKYKTDSAYLIICTTLECNFACPYCFETRESGYMERGVQKALISFINKLICRGIKKLDIDWFGGEPLLCINIIKELTEKINEICKNENVNVEYSITTNGYLLDAQVISLFKKLGINTYKITLDGLRETHDSRRILKNGQGTFDVIMTNIDTLLKQKCSVFIRVNTDKSNINAYRQIDTLFSQKENAHCYPAIVTAEPTQDKKQQERCYSHNEYMDFYNESYIHECNFYDVESAIRKGICHCCAEHILSYTISPDGTLYKCVNDLGNKEYSSGTIFIDERNSAKSIGTYMGRDPFSEDECRKCKLIPLCFGGCENEYRTKSSHACPPIKGIIKKWMRDRVQSINKGGT